MNVTTIDPEVRDYLEAVKARLADLPEEELDDLTIDLEAHLAEVQAEGTASLTDRLGPPADYARELRTTAGLGAGAPARSGIGRRFDGLVAAVRARLDAPAARKATDLWQRARPTWVVVRGWLLITLWVVVWSNWVVFEQFPIPHLGSTTMGIIAVAAATWLSLHAARKSPKSRRWRLADAGLTTAALLLLLMSLTSASAIGRNFPIGVDHAQAEADLLARYPLATTRNIYAYDLEGNPLSGVLLYDQDGAPLDLHPWVSDDQEDVAFLEDRFGQPIKNAYPLDMVAVVTYTESGEPIYEPMPEPRVPLPSVEAPDGPAGGPAPGEPDPRPTGTTPSDRPVPAPR